MTVRRYVVPGLTYLLRCPIHLGIVEIHSDLKLILFINMNPIAYFRAPVSQLIEPSRPQSHQAPLPTLTKTIPPIIFCNAKARVRHLFGNHYA